MKWPGTIVSVDFNLTTRPYYSALATDEASMLRIGQLGDDGSRALTENEAARMVED